LGLGIRRNVLLCRDNSAGFKSTLPKPPRVLLLTSFGEANNVLAAVGSRADGYKERVIPLTQKFIGRMRRFLEYDLNHDGQSPWPISRRRPGKSMNLWTFSTIYRILTHSPMKTAKTTNAPGENAGREAQGDDRSSTAATRWNCLPRP